MGMEVQYGWTVKDYIKEKGLSGEEVHDIATRRRCQTSTPRQIRIKMWGRTIRRMGTKVQMANQRPEQPT